MRFRRVRKFDRPAELPHYAVYPADDGTFTGFLWGRPVCTEYTDAELCLKDVMRTERDNARNAAVYEMLSKGQQPVTQDQPGKVLKFGK